MSQVTSMPAPHVTDNWAVCAVQCAGPTVHYSSHWNVAHMYNCICGICHTGSGSKLLH